MKRIPTVLALFGVSFLAVLAIFQSFTASQHQPENRIAPIALQTAQAEYMNASDSNKDHRSQQVALNQGRLHRYSTPTARSFPIRQAHCQNLQGIHIFP